MSNLRVPDMEYFEGNDFENMMFQEILQEDAEQFNMNHQHIPIVEESKVKDR